MNLFIAINSSLEFLAPKFLSLKFFSIHFILIQFVLKMIQNRSQKFNVLKCLIISIWILNIIGSLVAIIYGISITSASKKYHQNRIHNNFKIKFNHNNDDLNSAEYENFGMFFQTQNLLLFIYCRRNSYLEVFNFFLSAFKNTVNTEFSLFR